MTRGIWRATDENLALEAYSVLIRNEQATRSYPRAELMATLREPSVYVDFIKLCLEHDRSREHKDLKKGLLLVVRAVGVSSIARDTGLSRITLYRMLSPQGNPQFSSLTAVLRALGVYLWIVDRDFIKARERLYRPKDVPKTVSIPLGHRRLGRHKSMK